MEANIQKQSFNTSLLIKWLITFLVPLSLLLIPTNELFTSQIRLFLVLTMIAIFIIAFETLDYIVPGILLPAAYALFGLVNVSVAYAGWASYLPWMMLGSFVLANIFIETKFLNRIAYFCILKMGGSFKATCIGLMIVVAIIYTLTGGNGILLTVVLAFGMAKSFDIKMKSPEAMVLLVAGTLGAISAACFIPALATLGILIAGGKTVDPGFTMNYGSFIWHNLPYVLFIIGFFILIYKLYRPKVTVNGKTYFEEEYAKLGKISVTEKKCAVIATILVVFLLTGSLHKINVNWGFVILPWVMYMPGMNVGKKSHIQTVDFSILIFAVMCVSIGIVSSVLGFGELFAKVMLTVLGDSNTAFFLFLIAVAGIVLNVLLTPLAVLGAFAVPFAQIAQGLNIDMLPIFYTLCQSMDQIFMPYEYMPYLLFVSYGFICMADFIKIFTLKMVLHVVFLMLIMIPWWKFVGIL